MIQLIRQVQFIATNCPSTAALDSFPLQQNLKCLDVIENQLCKFLLRAGNIRGEIHRISLEIYEPETPAFYIRPS